MIFFLLTLAIDFRLSLRERVVLFTKNPPAFGSRDQAIIAIVLIPQPGEFSRSRSSAALAHKNSPVVEIRDDLVIPTT